MTWKQLRAIIFLPGMVAGVFPAGLMLWRGIQPGWGLPGLPAALALALGTAIFLTGFYLLSRSIALFSTDGNGTLAPWDPTDRLVVTGLYRYVRNPMYAGVLGVLLGEAVLAGSLWVLAWAALVFMAFNVFVRLYEEPHLRRTYTEQYTTYCENVPRWLPRLRPWEPDSRGGQ